MKFFQLFHRLFENVVDAFHDRTTRTPFKAREVIRHKELSIRG